MAHTTPKSYIVHHIPGKRIRLRVPSKKHDPAFFHKVQSRLNTLEGVKQAHVAPETGSILVHYSGDWQNLLIQGLEEGLTDLLDIEFGPEVAPITHGLVQQVGGLSEKLLASTHGRVDIQTATLLGLLVAVGIQIYRGQIFGPAIPLLWYAAETMRHYAPARG